MGKDKSYSIAQIKGLIPSERRSVVFLKSSDDDRVNAKIVYDKTVSSKKGKDFERRMLDRFDYWIKGGQQDKYFHGWNEPNYRNCFVFRCTFKKRNHRFYGFLCHPTPKKNARFQICVLISHDYKHEQHTDPFHKNLANELHTTQSVKDAIATEFPDV